MKENIERIVYYDGVCGLCDGFVELLVKLDKKKKLKFSRSEEHV